MNSLKKLFYALVTTAVSAFGATEALADNVALHTPGNFQVLAVSANGKWACGVYIDGGNNTFPFRWNLTSGAIEMLGTEAGTAMGVANDGTVSGDYADTEVMDNHAPITMPCYWRGQTRYGLEMPKGTLSDGIGTGISPDGKYMTGAICVDGLYTSYIWHEGKISRSLYTGSHNVAYCVAPDGQTAAGYNTLYNRTACYWPTSGDIVYFQDSPYCMGPWNYARSFSPDGTKLLYWGGWEIGEDEETLYLYSICDLTTGEVKKVTAQSIQSTLEFFDISNNELLVGYDEGRGYVQTADKGGMFIDDYLALRGVDLRKICDDMYAGDDYFVGQLPITTVVGVSEDENVFVMQYYNTKGESCALALKIDQDFTNVAPADVTASQLEGLHTVSLSWKRPVGANNIRGYNIYRNGKKVNFLPLNQLYYYDPKLENGEYTYEVSAVTTAGKETKAEAISVNVADPAMAEPYALFTRQKGMCNGFLTWKAPMSNLIHKRYYDVETKDFSGFSVYEAIDMEVAISFSKTEMAEYKGHVVSEVSFIPMGAQQSWCLNLYTRAADNSLQLLYTQPIEQELAIGTLNTVKLTTPQPLPSGDLVVAIAFSTDGDTQQVVGTQSGPVVPGYSDLLRRQSESDYISAYESSLASGITLTHLSWAIDLGLAPEGGETQEVAQYNVYLNGELKGSTTDDSYEIAALPSGTYTAGVAAQYPDGSTSEIVCSQLTIAAKYLGVSELDIEVSADSPTEVTATWKTPASSDAKDITYTTASKYATGVHGNQSTSYAFMISALYMPAKLRGYNGYRISNFRFVPMSDAIFTFFLYENGELIYEKEVDQELTFEKWNTVSIDEDIFLNENAEYRLVIDCFDPEPEAYVFALDSQMPFEFRSDLVSTDNGATWSSLSVESGTIGNWMMGMVVETPQPEPAIVDGYDVYVDNRKANTERIVANTFTHNLTKSGNHTIRVNTWYPGASNSAMGTTKSFNIDLDAIRDIAADSEMQIVRGTDYLQVSGEGVLSLTVYATSGASVASAKGNRVNIGTLTPGVYILKVETTDGPASARIRM